MTGQGKASVDTLLAESFKELVQQQPIEKITIKEITDKAGVIRPTFYNHFQDKYELLEWIIRTQLIDPMQMLLENGMFRQAMVLLFTRMINEKAFYMKASHLEGQNSFESIVKSSITKVVQEVLEKRGHIEKLPAWVSNELLAEYYAQSASFVMIKWIQSGMELAPETMAEVYDDMLHMSLSDVLRK